MDIRFPKDKGSSIVVIQGLEENVEDAKEHLVTLAEDYVSEELISPPYTVEPLLDTKTGQKKTSW